MKYFLYRFLMALSTSTEIPKLQVELESPFNASFFPFFFSWSFSVFPVKFDCLWMILFCCVADTVFLKYFLQFSIAMLFILIHACLYYFLNGFVAFFSFCEFCFTNSERSSASWIGGSIWAPSYLEWLEFLFIFNL